jgi:hypothetical protein
LLKGFRNRAFHGLIDHNLGIDLLATLLDPSFVPGINTSFEGPSGESIPIHQWSLEAQALAERYAKAFSNIATVIEGDANWFGWHERDRPDTISLVVHPLWAQFSERRNGLKSAFEFATAKGARFIRLVDSFNLSRRTAWVRAHRDEFSVVDLSMNTGVVSPTAKGSSNPTIAPQGAGGASEIDPLALPIGDVFFFGSNLYTRIEGITLSTAGSGGWLVRLSSGEIVHVTVKREPGMRSPQRRRLGGAPLPDSEVSSIVLGRYTPREHT